MTKNSDLADTGFPLDWAEDYGYHGFARSTSVRRYVVRLSVLGTQFNIGVETTQKKAAKLYDVALWKLAPFVSRTIKPNFPESFEEITAGSLVLDEIYRQCDQAAKFPDDLTESERREKALQPKKLEVTSSEEDYGRYHKLVEKTRANSMLTIARLSTARLAINFAKLPELQRVAGEYEQMLDQTEAKGRELHSLLTSHADFYKKLLANRNTAI